MAGVVLVEFIVCYKLYATLVINYVEHNRACVNYLLGLRLFLLNMIYLIFNGKWFGVLRSRRLVFIV